MEKQTGNRTINLLNQDLKLKTLLLIILVLLVIGGGIVGGYWYINQEESEDNTNNNTQPSINSKVEDLGNGSSRYTSHKMGFSIEYPTGWLIEETEIVQGTSFSVTFQNLNPRDYPTEGIFYKTPDSYRVFSVTKQTTGFGGESAEEFYNNRGTNKQIGGAGTLISMEEVILNNIPVKKIIEEFDGVSVIYYLLNSNHTSVYSISLTQKEILQFTELNYILSTFKML